MRRTLFIASAIMILLGVPTQAAQAAQVRPTAVTMSVEVGLARLGMPVGLVDGGWDAATGRATCAWRELTGRTPLRSWPTLDERRSLRDTNTLVLPPYMRVGININRQCQTAYWVKSAMTNRVRVATRIVTETITSTETRTVTETTTAGETITVDVPIIKVETSTRLETSTRIVRAKTRVLLRVMPVSTGMPTSTGDLQTVPGVHRVTWRYNTWWQSTIYEDGRMYRPMFFHNGQALHGSATDALVMTYPASHGCVRMLHADVDALWKAGFGPGDTVHVYGDWKG